MKQRTRTIGLAVVAAAVCVAIGGPAQAAVINLDTDLGPDPIIAVAQWTFCASIDGAGKEATFTADYVESASDAKLNHHDYAWWGQSTFGRGPIAHPNHPDYAPSYPYPDPAPVHRCYSAGTASGGWPTGVLVARPWDEPDIDTAENSYEVSITLKEGASFDLTGVAADFGFRDDGPNSVRVTFSTDGFDTHEVEIGRGVGFITEGDEGMGYGDDGSLNVYAPTEGIVWNRYLSDDIPEGEGQGLTGTVSFRIYAAGGQDNDAGPDGFAMRNLTIIPEPATMGLLAIGGLGVLLRRRRS